MSDLRSPSFVRERGRASTPALAHSDYWRRSQSPMDGVLGHKEWSHFCALAPDLTVIVNFSLMDCTSPSDRQVSEVPRVVLILRREGVWDGDLVQFAPEDARIGDRPTDLIIGTNRIEFADGCYHVDVAPNSDGLGAELRFWPLARPAIASSVRTLGGRTHALACRATACSRGQSLQRRPDVHCRPSAGIPRSQLGSLPLGC